MWNHPDLDDPVQARIEPIIRSDNPEYEYGKRRQDPTRFINASGFFGPVGRIRELCPLGLPLSRDIRTSMGPSCDRRVGVVAADEDGVDRRHEIGAVADATRSSRRMCMLERRLPLVPESNRYRYAPCAIAGVGMQR